MSRNFFFFFKAGRYCEWEHQTIDRSAETETFEEYKKTLRLVCEDGEPAILNWTVPLDAPDTLYYQVISIQGSIRTHSRTFNLFFFLFLFLFQCYTHKNLGWKIIVEDKGAHSANLGSTNIRTNISLPNLFLITLGITYIVSIKSKILMRLA